MQVFDLFFFEGYRFLEGGKFTFNDGIAGCEGISLSLQRGDCALKLIGDVLDMFVLFGPLLKQGLAERGVFVLEVIDSLLGLLILFAISQFLRIEFSLVVVDDLLQGPDLILQGFLLVAVELVQVVDVSFLLAKLILGGSTSISQFSISILEPDLKGLDFFLETIAFTIEDLSNSSLFLDELLNLAIFVAEGRIQLVDLVLQAVDILLMVYTHLLDLALVDLV